MRRSAFPGGGPGGRANREASDEAIAYFELAIQIKSDWPKAYHRLGLVCLNKGDFPKALANLKKFLELDPQNPQAASVKAAIAAIEQIKK